MLVLHLGLKRRILPGVRHQLFERPRIHHRAGKRVAAHLLALLKHGDGNFDVLAFSGFVMGLDQFAQVIRTGETSRSGTHKKHIYI